MFIRCCFSLTTCLTVNCFLFLSFPNLFQFYVLHTALNIGQRSIVVCEYSWNTNSYNKAMDVPSCLDCLKLGIFSMFFYDTPAGALGILRANHVRNNNQLYYLYCVLLLNKSFIHCSLFLKDHEVQLYINNF